VGFLVYVLMVWLCPTWALRGAVAVLQTLVMYALAGIFTPSLGDDLDDALNFKPARAWRSAAVGSIGLVLTTLALWGLSQARGLNLSSGWQSIAVGAHQQVLYGQPDLRAAAETLSDALAASDYFTVRGSKTVLLTHDSAGGGGAGGVAGVGKVVWVMEARPVGGSGSAVPPAVETAVRNALGRGVTIRVLDEQFAPVESKTVQ